MTEPTDPTTADPRTVAEAAVESLQGWLDGRLLLSKAAVQTLLADRARMAAELEQVRAAKAANVSDYEVALLAVHKARDYWQEQTVAEWTRAEKLTGVVAEAAELIDRLAFDDECSLDHHGCCQAHNVQPAPCPHPLGRQFVETWRPVQTDSAEAAR